MNKQLTSGGYRIFLCNALSRQSWEHVSDELRDDATSQVFTDRVGRDDALGTRDICDASAEASEGRE